MESLSFLQLAGLVGVSGYVTTFACLQLGLINGNGRLYSLVSIANASLVLISLTEQFNLPSAIIQSCWIVFGLIGLALKSHHCRKLKKTRERH